MQSKINIDFSHLEMLCLFINRGDIMNRKKKILLAGGTILLLLLVVVFIFLNNNKNTKETKYYDAYVSINPIVKLTFSVTCQKNECSNPIVTDFNLYNNDAKNIYKDIDFKKLELSNAINKIINVAKENNITFDKVNYYSNWNNKKYLENNEYFDILNIEIMNSTKLDKVIKDKNIKNKYTVSFDSDGGSAIPDQIVEENDKAIVPENPAKDGYTFIEWQLEGNKYDFDSGINKDIVLKAVWEKKVNNNDNKSNNDYVKESNTTSNDTTEETSIKYNYTGKYYWEDRYIQLNSDGSCIVNPTDVGTAGSVNGSCTYSMDLCSNPNACEAQNTRIEFCDDGNYAMEGTVDSSNKLSFVFAPRNRS